MMIRYADADDAEKLLEDNGFSIPRAVEAYKGDK